tara:strand:+ start:216 stop:488 length:273 start_codon:yes stop_codon:yes gene_type:complete
MKTINTREAMKKEILKLLNQAKQVYIYNGLLDYHFKSSKSELINLFKSRYKNQLNVKDKNGKIDTYYMNEFLTEFKENIKLNEHNQLFFN